MISINILNNSSKLCNFGKIMKKLFPYLRHYLDNKQAAPVFPDEALLDHLIDVSRKQGVPGILFDELENLRRSSDNLSSGYAKLMSMALQIELFNERCDRECKTLWDTISQNEKKVCLLKGQGMAGLYPMPYRRQCGDIDIWIPGRIEDTISFAKGLWPIDEIVYHHCHAHVFKKTSVELHFTPSWMFSPITNGRLQKYFDLQAERQCANIDPRLGISVPTPDFNSVFLTVHAYRHLFDEGIGLKQCLDLFFTLKQLDRKGRESAEATLRKLNMKRFTSGLMYILHKHLGLDSKYLLFKPDTKAGEAIMRSMGIEMRLGKERFPKRIYLKWLRRIRFLFLFTDEVIWAGWFKTWQYLWRTIKSYN